jgi:hypothetical protein
MAAGLLFTVTSLCAQTNNTIVVFSESGDRFYLILNGLRQNDAAATNVKSVALNQAAYKAKVIFEQKGIPDADKSLYMSWEGLPAENTEFVYSIKKDKKGKYKWSFVSSAPISANSPYASIAPSYPGGSANTATTTSNTNNNTQVATNANTGTTMNTSANTSGTIGMNTSMGVNDNTSNTNTTVTTTTTTTQGTNNTNGTVGMNMNGLGINMNISISDPLLNENSQTTTSSSTTTTSYTTSSTTTSSTGNPTTTTTYTASSTSSGTGNPATLATTTNYSDNSQSNINNSVNTSSSGCSWAMSPSDFESAKKSIAAKSFEDSKLTIAKQVLNSNCLNASQVREIMDQFTFEQNKLDWAKFAYGKTVDRNNYFKINDGFTFEASIDDLNEYISKQK